MATTLTRKHLEAIARAVRETQEDYGVPHVVFARVARALADELKPLCGLTPSGNSRFDRDRFLKACGVEVES